MKAKTMNGAAMKAAYSPATITNGARPALKLVEPRIDWLDQWYLQIGAKQMADKPTTSPLEWNGKVIGLIVSLMVAIGVIVTISMYTATLAAEVNHLKQDAIKVTLMRDAQVKSLETRLDKLEAFKEEQIRNISRDAAQERR